MIYVTMNKKRVLCLVSFFLLLTCIVGMVERKSHFRPVFAEGITDQYIQAVMQAKIHNQWQTLGRLTPFLHENTKNLEKVRVTATGYYAGVESTGKSMGHPQFGITFSGVEVRRDIFSTIAADPEVFPIGTILYVPGYGYAVVADTGSAIKGHIIDLYFETIEQVYAEWGKKDVEVYVIQRGTGKITESYMNALNNLNLRTEQAIPVFDPQNY